MRLTRSQIIQAFNAYLHSAENRILRSGDNRTYERRLVLLYSLKDLAVKIYAQDNVYVICDLIISRRSQLAGLYDGQEFSELMNTIENLQFKKYASCHGNYSLYL